MMSQVIANAVEGHLSAKLGRTSCSIRLSNTTNVSPAGVTRVACSPCMLSPSCSAEGLWYRHSLPPFSFSSQSASAQVSKISQQAHEGHDLSVVVQPVLPCCRSVEHAQPLPSSLSAQPASTGSSKTTHRSCAGETRNACCRPRLCKSLHQQGSPIVF